MTAAPQSVRGLHKLEKCFSAAATVNFATLNERVSTGWLFPVCVCLLCLHCSNICDNIETQPDGLYHNCVTMIQTKIVAAQRHRGSAFRPISNRSMLPIPSCWCYRLCECSRRQRQKKCPCGGKSSALAQDDGDANALGAEDEAVADELDYVPPRTRISSVFIAPPVNGGDRDDNASDNDDSTISSVVGSEVCDCFVSC